MLKALPLAVFMRPPRNGLMSFAVQHKCSEDIRGMSSWGRSNKRKLEIRCPRRKQAQEQEEKRMLLGVRNEGKEPTMS